MLGTGRKVQAWGEWELKQEVGHTTINSLKGGGSFAKFSMRISRAQMKVTLCNSGLPCLN